MFTYLPPHEDIIIPTNVNARIPDNMCLEIKNKSSVATKQKVVVGACVIDPSYQGQIFVHVPNYSNNMRFLSFWQKFAQAISYVFNSEEAMFCYNEAIQTFKEFKNQITDEKFYEGHTTAGSTGLESITELKEKLMR